MHSISFIRPLYFLFSFISSFLFHSLFLIIFLYSSLIQFCWQSYIFILPNLLYFNFYLLIFLNLFYFRPSFLIFSFSFNHYYFHFASIYISFNHSFFSETHIVLRSSRPRIFSFFIFTIFLPFCSFRLPFGQLSILLSFFISLPILCLHSYSNRNLYIITYCDI